MRYKLICSVITDKTNGKWKNDMIFIDFSPTSCEFSTQPGLVGPLPVKREKIKIFIALDDCTCMSICPNLVFHTFIRIYLKLGV